MNHFKLEGLVAVVASGTLARYVKTGPLCVGSMACEVRPSWCHSMVTVEPAVGLNVSVSLEKG